VGRVVPLAGMGGDWGRASSQLPHSLPMDGGAGAGLAPEGADAFAGEGQSRVVGS
jgi:hypothetical protein